MKRLGFIALLFVSTLLISQATTQQTTQETTTQQTTTQPTTQMTQPAQQTAPASPAWADPRLDEVEDFVMVRFANLSPNAGNVEISLMRDGQVWTFAQPATQPRFGQQQVSQQQFGTTVPPAQEQPGQETATQAAATTEATTTGQQTTAQQTTEQQTEQPGQETAQQEITGTATLEIYVEPDDAIISVAGPQQLAGQFQGSYRLSNLPAGTYNVTVTRLGYEVQEEEVELTDDDSQTLEISLQEAEGDTAERQRQEVQPEPEEPATTLTPRQDTQQDVQQDTQQPTQQVEEQAQVTQQPAVGQQEGMQTGLAERHAAQPSNLAYQDVTGYFMLPAGDYEVRILPAPQQTLEQMPATQQQTSQETTQPTTAQEQVGQQFPTTQQPATQFAAYETSIGLSAGNYYTVAAVGLVRGTDAEIDARVEEEGEGGFFGWLRGLFGADDTGTLELRLEVYEDAPGNLPRAGHALVRVIHAAPGNDTIEVRAWRGQPGMTQTQTTQAQTTQTQPATAQQTTPQQTAWTSRPWDERTDRTVASANYLDASGYEEVRAYAYDLELRLAAQEEGQLPLHSLAGIGFEPGGVYTVFMSGTDFAGYPLSARVSLDALVLGEPLQNLDPNQALDQGMQQGQ